MGSGEVERERVYERRRVKAASVCHGFNQLSRVMPKNCSADFFVKPME